jgi:hypothetical protein
VIRKPTMTMRRALSDTALPGNVLPGDSWRAWRILLIATMGEALDDEERAIFKTLTGRPTEPGERVDEFYRVRKVRGDRYAGEWPREQFRKHGVDCETAAKPKSELFGELLPVINSRRAALLDDNRTQLTALERRTSRGGKDSIDHPPGAHDDLANSVAGVISMLADGEVPGFLDFYKGLAEAAGARPAPAPEPASTINQVYFSLRCPPGTGIVCLRSGGELRPDARGIISEVWIDDAKPLLRAGFAIVEETVTC